MERLAEVPGEMDVLVRAQLTSLDGQQASLRVGQRCHFEADILAKYVERILAARGAPAGGRR